MSQSHNASYSDSLFDPETLLSESLPDISELPNSQPTIYESNSNYLPLPPPLEFAPKDLIRIGPVYQRVWVVYESHPEMEDARKQFVEWWLTTGYGKQAEGKGKIHWDGKKTSDIWQGFEQVAHERTGQPKVMCKRCKTTLAHPAAKRAGTSALQHHLKKGGCREPRVAKKGVDQLLQDMPHRPLVHFNQYLFQQKILNLITTARLPFRIVEHPAFQDLLQTTRHAESKLDIPSARSVRRLLDDEVSEKQSNVLNRLPDGSGLSIALDCWTSPFSQAFMAITGYFLDTDWNYCDVLLGFEPLDGSHSGAYLSETVVKILQQHRIIERVLSVTTDNASNNNTMVAGVQDVGQSLGLNEDQLFRIPCIVHVIQLSLRELLGKIKANPVNDEVESKWEDSQQRSQQPNDQQHPNIVKTLNKIRDLAIFINASPQRRKAFLELQKADTKLIPIQDVRTRWNSTFLMLDRARKIQPDIDRYCDTHHHTRFKLNTEEWRQVEYLLLLTKPFFDFTNLLSKTRDVTIQHIFSIYNKLFNHLDHAEEKLKRKSVPWKKGMLQALQAASEKLSKYYKQTDSEAYGYVYAIATILSPSKKLRYFDNRDWRGHDEFGRPIDFMRRYRDILQARFKLYQQKYQREIEPLSIERTPHSADDELEELCESQTALQAEVDQPEDEISRYLTKGLTKGNPRVFWKEHEQEYPVLARLARDILSIPASGAGVERLFNCARDICHYRRGQLKEATIKDLMIHLFSTRFEVEYSELDLIKEQLSIGEATLSDQASKPLPTLTELDPISEDDEDHERDDLSDSESNSDAKALEQLPPPPHISRVNQGQQKRAYSAIEPQNDHSSQSLRMPSEEGTQGRSGRIRKRPKMPAGFEIDGI